MQKNELLKSFECAVPHKCPKKEDSSKNCAQCEIGYSFVVCDPRILECGHFVCFECKSKVEKGSLKCKICGADAKYTEARGTSIENFFQFFLNDLTKELKDKFKNAVNLYNEKKETIEAKVNELRFKIKNEIENKSESLTAEINEMKTVLFKDVDQLFDKTLENLIEEEFNEQTNFKNQLTELENCFKRCEIDKEQFFKYQKSLKKMIDKIQNSFDFDLQIKFEPSNSFHSLFDLLGGNKDVKVMQPSTQTKDISSSSVLTNNSNATNSNPSTKSFVFKNPKHHLTFSNHTNLVYALAVLSNGDLVSGAEDGSIKVWNPLDGSLKQTITLESGAISLLLHSNGNLIIGLANGKIKIFNDFKLIKTLKEHSKKIWSLICLKNGYLASASSDKTIKIWSSDGVLINTLQGHTDVVYRLVELLNGDIASCSDDKTVKIWNIDGTLKKKLTGHTSYVNGLAVLPNGDLVTGSYDKSVKIWNAENGQLKKSFTIHSSCISCIKVLPNGDLAIGYTNGKIIISDTDGNLKFTIDGHSRFVWDMLLLPNGNLASASGDNKIKIWKSS